jgi:isochorismatase family protein
VRTTGRRVPGQRQARSSHQGRLRPRWRRCGQDTHGGSPADVTPVPDYGEYRTEIGLGDRDILVTKHGWNAFYGTELDLELRRRKVTGIVLAGISTSIGVESTARAANERGYELTIVTDAITDTDEGAHRNRLTAIFPRIAELATTEERSSPPWPAGVKCTAGELERLDGNGPRCAPSRPS